MLHNAQEKQKSRRQFLGAAAAGAASLTVTAVAQQTANAAEAAPSSSTVRDHLWLFALPAGLNDDYLEKGNYRGGSRMTPAEGAFYLNIPNLLFIRANELPKPPDDEQWRAKTTFEQYALSFRPLDRVVWSVVGSSGVGGMKELDYVLPLANKYPNINGIYLDDFIVGADISPIYLGDSTVGTNKPTTRPRVGRPALDRNELKVVRERLKSLGRPMDIWVTLYRHELLPNHPLHKACNPPLATLLDMFDVLTLWTSHSQELLQLEESLEALEAVAPKSRRIALGMYIWDYWANKPVPLELMQHQCVLGLKWLKEKRIQELIFLGNNVLDVGIPGAEFTREWIAKVGCEPV
jgi:hypothetical protein